MVNGKTAHKTEPFVLGDDFTVAVNLSFQLRLFEAPREIVLQLHESTGSFMGGRHAVNISIPVGAEGVKTEGDHRSTEFGYERRGRFADGVAATVAAAGGAADPRADTHSVRGCVGPMSP